VERYQSYLQAEAAIIHDYLGEINERKLSRYLFPRTLQESIHVVRGAKLDIMKSVGFTGVLQ